MSSRTRLLFFLLCILHILVAASFDQATREGIIASREKRKKQLVGVLEQIYKKLADHRSGKKLLAKRQLEHMEHKIQVYEHQIDEMDRELDEDEIQRKIEQAEKIRKDKMNREL